MFVVAVHVSSTYKRFMLGHIAPSTGQCHHIMTSVKLIVVEICLKVRQCQLVFLFFTLSVFKNGFSSRHCSLPTKKTECVRVVLLRESTLIFSTENCRMNAFLMCSLNVDYEFVCVCMFVYILLPFLKWAQANPAADPGQSPGAVSVVISLSRSVD